MKQNSAEWWQMSLLLCDQLFRLMIKRLKKKKKGAQLKLHSGSDSGKCPFMLHARPFLMFTHWLGVFRRWIHTGPVTAAHPCATNRGQEEKKTSKSSNEAKPLTAGLSAHVWGGNCKRLLPRSPSTHKLNGFYHCDSLLLGFSSWQFLSSRSRSLSTAHFLLIIKFFNF